MKHSELQAIVHNVGDSLASGDSLLIGVYEIDVFAEAKRSHEGAITADFLTGEVVEGQPSATLTHAVGLYRTAFARLCANAGGQVEDVKEAWVRFWSDALERRFTVIIADSRGRRSITEYGASPGQRVKILDALGRLRPKPSSKWVRPS